MYLKANLLSIYPAQHPLLSLLPRFRCHRHHALLHLHHQPLQTQCRHVNRTSINLAVFAFHRANIARELILRFSTALCHAIDTLFFLTTFSRRDSSTFAKILPSRRVCRGIATRVRIVRSCRHLIPHILPFSPPANHQPMALFTLGSLFYTQISFVLLARQQLDILRQRKIIILHICNRLDVLST